jgi:hypothetical protein
MFSMPPRRGRLQRPQPPTMRTLPSMGTRTLPTPAHTNRPTHPNRRMDMPRMRPTYTHKPLPQPNMQSTVHTDTTHQSRHPKNTRRQTSTMQLPNLHNIRRTHLTQLTNYTHMPNTPQAPRNPSQQPNPYTTSPPQPKTNHRTRHKRIHLTHTPIQTPQTQ